MLIGPAIGIAKMNPASKPVIDIVIILSSIDPNLKTTISEFLLIKLQNQEISLSIISTAI
jgi:putative ribosome biogenesis GTPase RsgA